MASSEQNGERVGKIIRNKMTREAFAVFILEKFRAHFKIKSMLDGVYVQNSVAMMKMDKLQILPPAEM